MDEMSRLPKHTNPLPGENSKIKPPIRINAIIIPEGATNGDMIEAMFPNLKGKEKAFAIHLYVNKDKVGEVSMDWWNAPFRKVEECRL